MTPKRSFPAMLAAAALVIPLAACNPPNSGNVVSANQAQVAQSVTMGTITDARPVTVQGGNNAADVTGTLAGGIIGGLIGNEIGGGTGQDIATVVGATAGAAAGNRAAGAATTQQSTEWFVQVDGGQTISVIQSQPTFSIGQRVQIVQGGGTTRLQP